MDRKAATTVLRSLLDGRDGETAAWLFGSVARGDASPRSDVDVAVLLARDPPPVFDSLLLDLEGRLEVVTARLPDLEAFVAAMRERLDRA